MILSILSIVINVVFAVVLNLKIYTDRTLMPNGEVRVWHMSPIDRLDLSDQSILLYLQLFLIAVSIISAVLILFGIQNNILKKVCLIGSIASALLFVIILVVTSNSHAHYA